MPARSAKQLRKNQQHYDRQDRDAISCPGQTILSACTPARRGGPAAGTLVVEQRSELLGHRAGQFVGIDDCHGACDSTASRRDRYRSPAVRPANASRSASMHGTQMPLEIIARIDRQGGIIDRRTIRDHHQDTALLGRPSRRLCAQISASPSIFSLSRPSRIIRPRLRRARRQGASADL